MNNHPPNVSAYRAEIESALSEWSNFTSDCPPKLREAVRYSLLDGGKRLRPVLVLLACEVCGGERTSAIPAAVAIEMIHTYSLIHDDLPAMDDDDLRRGRPTNHIQFNESTAILAGDGLLTKAFEVLATGIPNAVQAIQCIKELSQAAGVEGMVGGQQADLEAETLMEDAFESTPAELADRLRAIHRRKTGRLITCSVRMGAILGNADARQLTHLTTYGDAIGLAFQIADDLLDRTSSAEVMGKGVGKDEGLHKLTYPGLLGFEQSRREAERLVSEAEASLEIFGGQGAALASLGRYSIQREN